MINKYYLDYSYKKYGDNLFIVFDNEVKEDKVIENGNIINYYQNNRLIRTKITNLSKIMKIKSDGVILSPSRILIDVINSILSNAGNEKLSYDLQADYKVGLIKSIKELDKEYLYEIDIKDRIVNAIYPTNTLKIGDKVIVALANQLLSNGTYFKEYSRQSILIDSKIINENEIHVSELDIPVILDVDLDIGDSFFEVED